MLVPAAKVLARLAWLRLIRGRTLYVTGVLAVVPIVLAAIARGEPKKAAWEASLEAVLRFVIPLGAAIHVSGAVGDELEQKTFTYLWSRPIPRASVIAGRLAVMTPLIFGVAAAATLASFLVAGGATGADDLMAGLAGAGASALGCSLFAVGGGALFPRQPMLFTMGVFLTVEQFLFAIPAAKHLSIVSHTRVIAGLEADGSKGAAAFGLALLSAGWLAIGLYRNATVELAASKE